MAQHTIRLGRRLFKTSHGKAGVPGMKIHEGADPLLVWVAMFCQGEAIPCDELVRVSGLPKSTIRNAIGRGGNMGIKNVRALVNALGYEITLKRLPDPEPLEEFE